MSGELQQAPMIPSASHSLYYQNSKTQALGLSCQQLNTELIAQADRTAELSPG